MRSRCLPALITLALCLGMESPGPLHAAKAEIPRALLGVPLDQQYLDADRELARRLGETLGIELRHDDKFNTYGDLIERVTTTRDPYLARMTPYAFVAAEMLGARLEVLATYESVATGSTTYRSYFVVNAEKFREFGLSATVDDVFSYLQKLQKPARFIYHDKFSTSSYLLPALWFRTHRIFATEQPASSVLRVEATKGSTSSSESVDKVASEQAEVAAVWDGTKLKYTGNPAVLFIPLPLTLPNDLLVAPTSLDEQVKTAIRKAIDASGEIGIGDFKRWRNVDNADNAREAIRALGELKRVARDPASVVVRVNADTANQNEGVAERLATIADDARQAIRLAGTEVVLENP
jgi:ABC-type phosphate/phosphonate transport system substrate-binding protein